MHSLRVLAGGIWWLEGMCLVHMYAFVCHNQASILNSKMKETKVLAPSKEREREERREREDQ